MINDKKNDLIPMEITVETLKTRIHMIRGQHVMLDSDLAELYGYSTKAFNQQVKNNIEKFDEDFRFQLTDEEVNDLRSNFLTANINTKSRYAPYVFTETGIYMLMTILRGELATRQSKALIRSFKQMKDYLNGVSADRESGSLVDVLFCISENTREISRIKDDMVTKEELVKVIQSFSLPERNLEYVIYSGQTIEADAAYADIYSKSKSKLFIVDNYIGPKTLLMLKSVPQGVDIVIFSDNNRNILRLSEYMAFKAEYPNINISFRRTGGKFHDRYIVIDYKSRSEKIFHCGASSKDAGIRITTISQADNKKLYHPMIEELLQQPLLMLK